MTKREGGEIDRLLDALADKVAPRVAARLAEGPVVAAVRGLFSALDAAGADLDCARAHTEFLEEAFAVTAPPLPRG